MASSNMRIRALTIALLVLALVLIVIGIVYLVTTANGLPSFFPGHHKGSNHHHVKHGILAIGLGVVALVGAWLTTAPDRTATPPVNQ
jgi:amino acid permease